MSDRQSLLEIILAINPFDEVEVAHIRDTKAWIQSGARLYRVRKPDVPPKHLVSYFVVLDESARSVMLVDHVKARLWLPAGGHVEPGEDPRTTVTREAKEELSIDADFSTSLGDTPFFITVTETIGEGKHTDVSLWYVIRGGVNDQYEYDHSEFDSYKWFTFDEVLSTDPDLLDPHMHRFIKKLMGV